MESNLNKLVSLSFDEDPGVRKKAANSLGEMDDPAAIFALVELSFDKDPSVREIAQTHLEKKKQSQEEVMSFAEIFASAAPAEKTDQAPVPSTPMDAKEKMLRPITQIFEKRLGKEKADAVKSKMMPTIEKIYLKTVHDKQEGRKADEESGRSAMQEFLTSYLEVISGIEHIGDGPTPLPQQRPHRGAPRHPPAEPPKEEPAQEPPVLPQPPEAKPAIPAHRPELKQEPGQTDLAKELGGQLEVVGKQTQVDTVSSELATIESQEFSEMREEEGIERLPDTFFKKAYETMMLSGGDEKVMKSEMNRMILEATREIGLAFRFAKKRFKETRITNITKIKDGMRNINSDPLVVRGVENITYQKSKKQTATLTKVLVNDDAGNEGMIYLPDDRGALVKPGSRIKLVRCMAKTFDFSGETALTLGKKGNVYIVL